MVGMSASSTNVTVTGSVSTTAFLPDANTSQTLVMATKQDGNDNDNIYTVTAGKVFYCLGVSIASTNAGRVGIHNDGTLILNTSGAAAWSNTFTGGVLFTVAATKSITIHSSAGATNAHITLWGFEK